MEENHKAQGDGVCMQTGPRFETSILEVQGNTVPPLYVQVVSQTSVCQAEKRSVSGNHNIFMPF